MVKSPLQIILEILVYIILTMVETILTVSRMLGELFFSLTVISQVGVLGLIISSIIGGLVLFFVSKFLFGTSKSLIKIALVYVALVLVLFFVFVSIMSAQ